MPMSGPRDVMDWLRANQSMAGLTTYIVANSLAHVNVQDIVLSRCGGLDESGQKFRYCRAVVQLYL
jgi:hypothetical protein